jgi:hypothetical protein
MFYLKAKVVPRSKTHHLGYEKQSIGAVYVKSHSLSSQTHTKHVNTLCGQNVEFLKVRPVDVNTNRWAFKV